MPLLEDIRLLKSDEQNPHRMTIKQLGEVWRSLKKHGWAFPIVTDIEGVFSDGEQRAQVCREHGEFFAPVLKIYLSAEGRRNLCRKLCNKGFPFEHRKQKG